MDQLKYPIASVLVMTLLLTACVRNGTNIVTGAVPTPQPTISLPASSTPSPTVSVLPSPTVSMLPSPTVAATEEGGTIPVYSYEVVETYPHDAEAWTQGLVYADGAFYEGTGQWGQSSVRRVEPSTGAVEQIHRLADAYYGEGIAVVGERVVQVTWQAETGFVYDRRSLEPVGTFTYVGEGWGLTFDGRHLILSDGSNVLRFLDPQSFGEVKRVAVTAAGEAVMRLNELEWVEGAVYANVWLTDRIVRIDPESGAVTAWIDLQGLLTLEEQKQADVLNGIAYDPDTQRLFVTGKLWPKLFQITLVEPKHSMLRK